MPKLEHLIEIIKNLYEAYGGDVTGEIQYFYSSLDDFVDLSEASQTLPFKSPKGSKIILCLGDCKE